MADEYKALTAQEAVELIKEGILYMVRNGMPIEHATVAFKRKYALTAIKVAGNKCAAADLIKTHRNTIGRIVPEKHTPTKKRISRALIINTFSKQA